MPALDDMQKKLSKYASWSLIAYFVMLLLSPIIAARINEYGFELAEFAGYIWFYWLFAIAGSVNDGWPCVLWLLFAGGIFWEIKKGIFWKGVHTPMKDHFILHSSLVGITTLPTILFGLHIISYVGP